MEMKQCKKGHFYDAGRNAECPYCNAKTDISFTRPLTPEEGISKTVESAAPPPFPKTMPAHPSRPEPEPAFPQTVPLYKPEPGATMAIQINEKGIDPVRGWLVCIEGEKKGKDFRIHSEKNFIGRAKSNDICLEFDETISRECNSILSYDARKNKFWLQSGDGKGNVYVNEDILLLPVELKAYDIISIGKTRLLFLPLCTNKFTWE